MDEKTTPKRKVEWHHPMSNRVAFGAGAVAGLAVDLTLYPLDTIKTRLQSQQGFKAAGGFGRIYAGIPAVTVGSAPSAALFFWSYEKTKRNLETVMPHPSFAHMTSACVGEFVACLIRVPTEVFKQRAQATPGIGTFRLVTHSLLHEGARGMYRGYWSTVSREIPFSLIEFPLWEYFKRSWSTFQEKPVSPLQAATCGSVAGAIAAGLTTPLDLAKTRIMLSKKVSGENLTVKSVITDIYKTKGLRGVFAGFWPRVIWMALGGFVFFGAFDKASKIFGAMVPSDSPEHFHYLSVNYYVTEFINKCIGAVVGEERNEKRPQTFEDSLKESAETEEKRRLAIIAAMKQKFEGRTEI